MTVESVFINCPFDVAYQPSHDAIVLTVVSTGMQPRSALESGTASKPRMQRIKEGLLASRYSIHDLSRAHGDPDRANLARLNMPFELGMAYLLSDVSDPAHEWLGLVPEQAHHAEYLSDLAGHDLEAHAGSPSTIIPPVLAWLSTRPTASTLPAGLDPTSLVELLPEFEDLLSAKRQRWDGRLRWGDLVGVARDLIATRFVD